LKLIREAWVFSSEMASPLRAVTVPCYR